VKGPLAPGTGAGASLRDGEDLPLDRRLDRRDFIRRLGEWTAMASAGSLASVWQAAPVAGAQTPSITVPAGSAPQETDPAFLTIAEAARLLQEGELSAAELVQACLDRVRRYDPLLEAFNEVTGESALEWARAVDRGATADYGAPLAGIPLAIKDNFFTAGVRTTANSHIFADFVPTFDAEAWRRLRAAGAAMVGKTQMGPLATSRATTPDGEATTMNAWAPGDARVSPGGSSSGSATAVAAGLALGATGTQTGGSITNPSSSQGLTGIKPTMGRVSLRGIIPLTYTRDHPGPLARDAADAGLLLQVMAGPDPADPRSLGHPPVPDLIRAATPVTGPGERARLRWPTRIGVFPDYLGGPQDPPPQEPEPGAGEQEWRRFERRVAARAEAEAAVGLRRRMLETFQELGAEVVEIPPPRDWATLTGSDFNNVRLPERSEPFLETLREDVRLFGVSLSPWINGLLLPGAEFLRGQRAKLLLLSRVLEGIFDRCDVVLQTSPVPFDIIGLPLVTFPIGFREGPLEEGREPMRLPVGALFGGMPFAEDRLLSLAAAWQSVTDFHRQRPPEPVVDGPGPGGSRPEPGRLRLDVVDVWETGE
jgi:Asp-tRNA(Asn)/Glu-tRNA(Gln) amidotransferase A subunit family amidase